MTSHLVVFEDSGWSDLRPLTDLVPVPALAFGASCLASRIAAAAGLPLGRIEARADAMAACRSMPPVLGVGGGGGAAGDTGDLIAVNGAALPGAWLAPLVASDEPGVLREGGRIVAARVPAGRRAALGAGAAFADSLATLGLTERAVEARWIDRPWQLMGMNVEAIESDLRGLAPALRGDLHASAVVLEPSRVCVEPGVRIDPLACLDAREGPILVRRGARIGTGTVVVGPCVVGEDTQLLGGVITHSTIGRQCRIAGEVEACVWQGFGNKRHHGFVGHSVIGEWVNLGALTTTSDLKNNYGVVRVTFDGREHDTGSAKVGAMIGAHAKTGIGSLLPTGGVIGTGANVFGGGRFAPKWVPSFGWWDGETLAEHRLDAMTATATTAMSRRGELASAADREALERLFEATRGERVNAAR